ncbi:hypothetical protein C8J56DRAFT_1027714 [Mycena floridula]|nr:hypothetical protein C8J56DRAFT_1027714 [Mycena floridula]
MKASPTIAVWGTLSRVFFVKSSTKSGDAVIAFEQNVPQSLLTATLTASANETGSPPKLISSECCLRPSNLYPGIPERVPSLFGTHSSMLPWSFANGRLRNCAGISFQLAIGSSWSAYIEDTYWLEPEAKLVEDARKELVAFRSRLLQYWWLTIQHDKRQWTWGLG